MNARTRWDALAEELASPTVGHDPGDEDDGDVGPPWRRWRFVAGKAICVYPRSWFEEKVRALPDHDPGDEDPWQPISELSERRLAKKLGLD